MGARLTFRDKANGRAWQKALRDEYLHEGAPDIDLNLKRARVRKVSRKMAERIILKYEWLGTMGNSGLHYGIFFDDYCAGVCCVALNGSGTAGNTVHLQFGLRRSDVATLVRGACVHWAPTGANSKLVAWTCKLLSRDSRAKLIGAYSDSDAGEVGTIYQACGWVYVGKTSQMRDQQIVSPAGRVYDRRNISSWAKSNGVPWSNVKKKLVKDGWKFQDINKKGRYVKQIGRDSALAARLKAMAKPYPKRNYAPESSTLHGSPVEVGGATPTPALKNKSAKRVADG